MVRCIVFMLCALLFAATTEAQCRGGVCRVPKAAVKAAVAPVKVVHRVKPVRRAAVLPVKLLRRCCR